MAIKPCHFVTLESASCSSSTDCLAELLGISSEDFEQTLMGCRDTVNRPFLYPPPFFSWQEIAFFFFSKTYCHTVPKVSQIGGEDANGSRGRAVGREN